MGTFDPILSGERVRKLRKARGLSQAKLAQAIGVWPFTVFKYEKGDFAPRIEQLVSLTRVLGVSADFLLFGSEAA
ncbi:MAG: helix-turn-helix transcriptional regulator [Planctomycetota bacterium]